ncbi:LexA family transcriptional repressor [Endozoicomonas sp. OPT23]|uniref:XRE family transcriptional regulator n=1 Tax=Endozoicomonas sp. OPT23 TaxID=2072845 RepID=UPI00129A56D6|nr:XRE family transcriptional regulator [Endozoicomonas sp. OPT23]MRI35484.1 LexA family transcriptional repressor [Endozoicomonas sp. OPT23]
MSNAFARRFQLVVDQLAQGNKKQFAELTGKSASHIYKICRGISRPSMTYLESLYDGYKVDLNWLLTGEQSEGGQVAGSAPGREVVYAPMFDVQASAGTGASVSSEDISGYFTFDKVFLSRQLGVSGEDLAFVTISGDSMLPTFQDGDQVLVDMSAREANSEAAYLLKTDDGLMAKRLKQSNHKLSVNSDNPDYPSWTINLKEQEDNPVLGRIVWCARSV